MVTLVVRGHSRDRISDAFDFHGPELYKLVTTVTRDYDSQNTFTITVVRLNQQTSVKESKYKKKPKSELIVPSQYISKKELRKMSEKKTMRL